LKPLLNKSKTIWLEVFVMTKNIRNRNSTKDVI
jgi:hypothetical protein